jgi:hypothetical protein
VAVSTRDWSAASRALDVLARTGVSGVPWWPPGTIPDFLLPERRDEPGEWLGSSERPDPAHGSAALERWRADTLGRALGLLRSAVRAQDWRGVWRAFEAAEDAIA